MEPAIHQDNTRMHPMMPLVCAVVATLTASCASTDPWVRIRSDFPDSERELPESAWCLSVLAYNSLAEEFIVSGLQDALKTHGVEASIESGEDCLVLHVALPEPPSTRYYMVRGKTPDERYRDREWKALENVWSKSIPWSKPVERMPEEEGPLTYGGSMALPFMAALELSGEVLWHAEGTVMEGTRSVGAERLWEIALDELLKTMTDDGLVQSYCGTSQATKENLGGRPN